MEWLLPVLTEVNDVTFIEEGTLSVRTEPWSFQV